MHTSRCMNTNKIILPRVDPDALTALVTDSDAKDKFSADGAYRGVRYWKIMDGQLINLITEAQERQGLADRRLNFKRVLSK